MTDLLAKSVDLHKHKEPIQDATSKWIVHCNNHDIRCFTRTEIERITNNYSDLLGQGSFGKVYTGVLEDGHRVAVKKLIRNVAENFHQELTVHREINHRNVVRLIGYCVEENNLMMVTEYIPNGNLCDALHRHRVPIPLDIRLRIAIECAEALAYMHSHMYTQVIHGDIKPANILLDCGFNAKVSDFGISRLIVDTNKTLYTEHVMGSIGYMDPMFARDGRLTVKSDVYSFGVVLFELISRKKATIANGVTRILDPTTEALASGIKDGVREMFDSEIASQDNIEILEEFGNLVVECLTMERDKRPEMIEVAERLRAMLRRKSERAPSAVAPVRRFSFAEMKAATNNFDEFFLVNQNPFGSVYRGKICGGATKVAIKRHHVSASFGNCEFGFALAMTGVCNSSSVHLVGYCLEHDDEIILVYEYMARGSLRDNLYSNQKVLLTWKRRLEICISTARALHKLHRSRIIHCNVNTTDILLDEEWGAKISDLGFCRIGLSTDKIPSRWSYGRVDPEYLRITSTDDNRLTEKSDVYCFGAVLFEVLCARPIVEHIPPERFVSNVSWAMQFVTAGSLDQIVEPRLYGKIYRECLDKFADIACRCLADRGRDRPTMEVVLSELEYAMLLQESSEASGC